MDEPVYVKLEEAAEDGFPAVADVAAGVHGEVVEEGVESGPVGEVVFTQLREAEREMFEVGLGEGVVVNGKF